MREVPIRYTVTLSHAPAMVKLYKVVFVPDFLVCSGVRQIKTKEGDILPFNPSEMMYVDSGWRDTASIGMSGSGEHFVYDNQSFDYEQLISYQFAFDDYLKRQWKVIYPDA